MASLRIVQNCCTEIPRITITTPTDREINDRLEFGWSCFSFFKYALAEADTFSGASAQLAEMTTTAI